MKSVFTRVTLSLAAFPSPAASVIRPANRCLHRQGARAASAACGRRAKSSSGGLPRTLPLPLSAARFRSKTLKWSGAAQRTNLSYRPGGPGDRRQIWMASYKIVRVS